MSRARRKLGFVLAASSHGPLILNRFDYHRVGERLFGVGGEILARVDRQDAGGGPRGGEVHLADRGMRMRRAQ